MKLIEIYTYIYTIKADPDRSSPYSKLFSVDNDLSLNSNFTDQLP